MMPRDPEKTERIVIHCRPRLKRRWTQWEAYFDENPEALRALLRIIDENPELVRSYGTK